MRTREKEEAEELKSIDRETATGSRPTGQAYTYLARIHHTS